MPTALNLPIPTLKRGEHYAGFVMKDGSIEGGHHVILLPGETTANWENATAWATKKRGTLPDRREARLLYVNQQAQFNKDSWYWTSEQHPGYESCACVQLFDVGSQRWFPKGYAYRARAVRRVII